MRWGAFLMLVCVGAIRAQAPTTSTPRVTQEAKIDPKQPLNFSALLWPTRVYVGQQATYEIGIFLTDEMRGRLRNNPQFVPPDVPSTIGVDLPVPAGPLRRTEANEHYGVHVFARGFFPLTPGQLRIAPARLTYAVALGNSFFSREESHSLRSDAVTLDVREPPVQGRPSDYSGAVGELSISATLDVPRTRVGDPVVLTVVVRGTGNVALFPRPLLNIPWAQTVNGAERVRVDSSAYVVRGAKEFDFVVTPRKAGRVTTPEVRYPYFDPYRESYAVATAAPLTVEVTPGTLASVAADSTPAESWLPLRREFRGPVLPPLSQPLPMLLLALIAPLPLVAARLRQRRRHPAPVAALKLKGISPDEARDPVLVRRAFARVLEYRLLLPHAVFGDIPRLYRLARRRGVTEDTGRALAGFVQRLSEAAYGMEVASPYDWQGEAERLLAAIDHEAVARNVRMIRAVAVTTTLLIVSAVALAQSRSPLASFRAGLLAYDRGDAPGAASAFHDAALIVPTAADAWANYGTASWYAADTAAAVLGWQRALRLEPLADDVRSRLIGGPGFTSGFAGEVPPFPTQTALWVAVGVWCVVFGSAGVRVWRRASALRARDRALLLAASLLAVVAVGIGRKQLGRSRVVVLTADALRDVPAFGAGVQASIGAAVLTGETAQRVGQEGAWSRLQFDDGRAGWIASQRITTIGLPPR